MNNTATNTATCPTVRKQIGETPSFLSVPFTQNAKEEDGDKKKPILREGSPKNF